MELLVAGFDDIKFNVEIALDEQHGALPLPFNGMDKSIAAVCSFYPRGSCSKGALCPMRHVRGDRTVVCKHWLRGLCKKGDQCEFLHEYDMTKMPECYFYARFNACHNKECPFLHIDPESKLKECPWYDRGFCRHGPHCKHKHVRRVLCMNYVAGFCPDGLNFLPTHQVSDQSWDLNQPSLSTTHPDYNVPSSPNNFGLNQDEMDYLIALGQKSKYNSNEVHHASFENTSNERNAAASTENYQQYPGHYWNNPTLGSTSTVQNNPVTMNQYGIQSYHTGEQFPEMLSDTNNVFSMPSTQMYPTDENYYFNNNNYYNP